MTCRSCETIDIEAIEASVDAYIGRIDKKLACDDGVYTHRLNVCKTCTMNREGMCGVCGCFVKVRAYKKHMTCPSVKGNQWRIDGDT